MYPRLGVNIDHVATLREARGTSYPDVLTATKLAISGGAAQITVHLREDRRHIQDNDVYLLKDSISVPLNLEMAAEEGILAVALGVRPAIATLVPEKREELTTEGGLDCVSLRKKLIPVIAGLKAEGIEVSLFIEPNEEQIVMAKELHADTVELHTGRYAETSDSETLSREIEKLAVAARTARKIGLRVAAGHGLNYENTAALVSALPEVVEYNIGHAIVARAVFTGLMQATEEMVAILRQSGRNG